MSTVASTAPNPIHGSDHHPFSAEFLSTARPSVVAAAAIRAAGITDVEKWSPRAAQLVKALEQIEATVEKW